MQPCLPHGVANRRHGAFARTPEHSAPLFLAYASQLRNCRHQDIVNLNSRNGREPFARALAFGFDSNSAALLGALKPGRRHSFVNQIFEIAMLDDSVQVRCRRCRGAFRERARRLQNGYSRQCPTCEVVLFFDEDSHDQTIRRAMKSARQVRAALREAELERPRRKRVLYGGRGSGGRGSYETAEAEDNA